MKLPSDTSELEGLVLVRFREHILDRLECYSRWYRDNEGISLDTNELLHLTSERVIYCCKKDPTLSFETEKHFLSWIAKTSLLIAKEAAKPERRRKQYRQKYGLHKAQEAAQGEDGVLGELQAREREATTLAASAALDTFLRNATDKKDRSIVRQIVMQGKTVQRVARRVNLSPSETQERCNRTLQRALEHLRKLGFKEEP